MTASACGYTETVATVLNRAEGLLTSVGSAVEGVPIRTHFADADTIRTEFTVGVGASCLTEGSGLNHSIASGTFGAGSIAAALSTVRNSDQ